MKPNDKAAKLTDSQWDTTLQVPQETANSLKPGMYVRIPVDINDTPIPGEHRDFRLAQVVSVTDHAARVVAIEQHDEHRLQRLPPLEIPLDLLSRCTIAERGRFIHRDTRQWGLVLAPCDAGFKNGVHRTYFAQLGDDVQMVSEAELYVPFTEGASDPVQQLLHYEFHPPRWRAKRDSLVESYAMLQAATFGIEGSCRYTNLASCSPSRSCRHACWVTVFVATCLPMRWAWGRRSKPVSY